ncbi:MAG: hypothetical protein JNM18_23395 [Planctomycetaceae bacterium]|nr:hypothetical protein [Planctomycetaceae bacterium]
MQRRLFLGTLLLAAFIGATTHGADEVAKTGDYYPLKLGTKWNYELKVGDRKVLITNQVAKIETIDEQKMARVETVMNNNIAATEHLTSTTTGVFRTKFNGSDVNPPICLLKLPVKVGDEWKDTNKIGNDELKTTCKVEAAETIEVPAGKFDTLRVNVSAQVGDQSVETIYWFAEGTGVVKQSFNAGDMKLYIELESIKKGE